MTGCELALQPNIPGTLRWIPYPTSISCKVDETRAAHRAGRRHSRCVSSRQSAQRSRCAFARHRDVPLDRRVRSVGAQIEFAT
jgi:hypothetical protein